MDPFIHQRKGLVVQIDPKPNMAYIQAAEFQSWNSSPALLGHVFDVIHERRCQAPVAHRTRALCPHHIASGYAKIAIENGHRNSGFSHETW